MIEIINEEQLVTLIIEKIETEWDFGERVAITDEEDLHDFVLGIKIGGILIEDYDYIYYQIVGLLPQIFDEVIDFIENETDYYEIIDEQWRVYYSLIAI